MQVGLTRVLFVYLFFSTAVLSVMQTDLIFGEEKIMDTQLKLLSEAIRVVKNINFSSTNNGGHFNLLKKFLIVTAFFGVSWRMFKKLKMGELLKKHLTKLASGLAMEVSQKYGIELLRKGLTILPQSDTALNRANSQKIPEQKPVAKPHDRNGLESEIFGVEKGQSQPTKKSLSPYQKLDTKELSVVIPASDFSENGGPSGGMVKQITEKQGRLQDQAVVNANAQPDGDNDTLATEFAASETAVQNRGVAAVEQKNLTDGNGDSNSSIKNYQRKTVSVSENVAPLSSLDEVVVADQATTKLVVETFNGVHRVPGLQLEDNFPGKKRAIEVSSYDHGNVGDNTSLAKITPGSSWPDGFLLSQDKKNCSDGFSFLSTAFFRKLVEEDWIRDFHQKSPDVTRVKEDAAGSNVSYSGTEFDYAWLIEKGDELDENDLCKQNNHDDHRDTGVKPTFCFANKLFLEKIKNHLQFFALFVPSNKVKLMGLL